MSVVIPISVPEQKAVVAHTGVAMAMPVRIGAKNLDLWLLPIEPLVSVRSRNIITSRSVSKTQSNVEKGFGTVKELWTQDDYEVVITGVLYDHNSRDALPTEMISRLNRLCTLRKPVIVECARLEALGISQLSIIDFEFPHTNNIAWQNYAIRAVSDQDWNLLIEK